MTRNQELLEALTGMPPIPGLREEVMRALGAGGEEEYHRIPVVGFHLTVGVDVAAVYLVTDRIFALFEANASGRSYTLGVSLPRVRRIGRFEDAVYTRLVIELEADRVTTVATMDPEGRSEGQIVPAGYELLESETAGRESLRRFAAALTTAIAL